MPTWRVYSGHISTIGSPRDSEHGHATCGLLGPCGTPGDCGAAPRPWAQKKPPGLATWETALLAFAPAVCRFVAVPRAPVFAVVQLHRYTVFGTLRGGSG